MKKSIFTRIISVMLICMMMIGSMALGISAEETATTTPTVEIVSNNVKYGETLKLMYAVKTTGMTDGQTLQVVLCDANGNVIGGTVRDTEDASVDGETLPAFVSKSGVPAQNIDKVIYAKAQILEGENVVAESEVQAYSVLEYLWERLNISTNVTEAQKNMYNALLAYAAAADIALNGSDSISNLTYVVFNGVGDMYSVGDEIELIDDSLVADDGEEIVWTVNGEKYTEATYVVTNEFVDIKGEVVEIPAVEMTIPEALEAADGTKVIVTGKVVVAGAWNSTYNNMNVTIEDENGNQLYVYRLATEVALGDTIVVTGAMDTYNSARQIAQGATAEIIAHEEVVIPEVTIAEALAAEDGTNIVVTGTVKKINTAWSDSYGNISVTIVDENGNELYIYRLATKVALYDVIKVTGSMATHNGARQIGEGATAEITGTHESCEGYYKEADCLNPATCIVCGGTTGEAKGHSYVDGACSVCGATEGVTIAEETLAIIANASTSGGVVNKTITWTGTNVTFFHEQGSSTSAILDTQTDHFRCYKSSTTTISVASGNITKIAITATSSSYATTLVSSLTAAGYTAVANGSIVTITLDGTTNSISFSHTAGQTRVNSIVVTYEG